MNRVIHGDSLEVMAGLDAESVDAIVTDPPYGLRFMGKSWDRGLPGEPFWTAALRVAKPGAYLLAFGGTRTYHRLTCAVEDAGWEIRDCLMFLHGQGFPKSLNLESEYRKKAKAAAKCDVRFVRASYLSTPFYACRQCGQVLLPCLPESSLPDEGDDAACGGTPWAAQLRMEGGRDLQAPERELLGCPVCTMSHGVLADGPARRIHSATSADNGAHARQAPALIGGGPPQGPQSVQQRAGEPDAVFLERRAQASRGYGTALKPAFEPIILARKPMPATVCDNAARFGTGALQIDACRLGWDAAGLAGDRARRKTPRTDITDGAFGKAAGARPGEYDGSPDSPAGRWPANVMLDEEAAAMLDEQSGERGAAAKASGPTLRGVSTSNSRGRFNGVSDTPFHADSGGASRFFYCAKASRVEREAGLAGDGKPQGQRYGSVQDARPHTADGYEYPRPAIRNPHPTVKPITLMRWLCRLVTPPGGLILDPFAGSGSTGCAAVQEGLGFIGIEKQEEYVTIARARVDYWYRTAEPTLPMQIGGNL